MLPHTAMKALLSCAPDASALDEATTRAMAAAIAGLPAVDLDDVSDMLEEWPNFIGSSLFDQVVDHLPAVYRRCLWETGQATDEQARRHFATEAQLAVRRVMALTYDVGPAAEAVLLGEDNWKPAVWHRRVMDVVTAGRGNVLPVAVLRHLVQQWPEDAFAGDREALDKLLREHEPLAAAVAGDPNAPVRSRLAACANRHLEAGTVVAVTEAVDPAVVTEDGLVVLLGDRPVMTRRELAAVRDLAKAAELEGEVRRDIEARHGWELSEGEFCARVASVSSAAQLEELLGRVPQGQWFAMRPETVGVVVSSEWVTAQWVYDLCHIIGAPYDVASWWPPTDDVWDHQLLLAVVLGMVRSPSAGDEVTEAWKPVLTGTRAQEFTTFAIAHPHRVQPKLWCADVAWSGDLGELALSVPAHLWSCVGSSALSAQVLNALERADGGTGTLWAVVESFTDGPAGAATLRDVLGAHAAAVGAGRQEQQ